MSNLIKVYTKFYDSTGRILINLEVQSKYKGSINGNFNRTDKSGYFIFEASPNRVVEVLIKLPNSDNYTSFEVFNSLIDSSISKPKKIKLPKPIEEYKKSDSLKYPDGTVGTLFKVVDINDKILVNFPIRSRPKGKTQSYENYTNEKGLVEVRSSPNRDIEFLVLKSDDQFILKYSVNSRNGIREPILIKLDEPYSKFKSITSLHLLDRDGSDFIIKNTKVEMILVDSGKKQIFSMSNGRLPLTAMVGQKLKFIVYKPDGKPLDPQEFFSKRVKEPPVKLFLDVDITNDSTKDNNPNIDKNIDPKILITIEQMKKMWPKANVSKMLPIMNELNSDLVGYKLDSRLRQAHFMAQVRQEVGASFSLREQVEYMGPTALKQIGYYKSHPKQADIDGYKKGKGPANGETIANRMYDDNYRGAKFKLGNTAPGDGWKYLGRGLKQLTGKANYKDLTDMYGIIWSGEKVDFVKNPELIEQPKYAVRSAIRFWLKFKLYEIADKGKTSTQVDAITRVINLATDSYVDRRSHFIQANQIFI